MICNKGTCVLSCFALLCIVALPSTALINLAKDKSTSQSTNFDSSSVSGLAVDGCTEQDFDCSNTCNNYQNSHCCTHQLTGQSDAWWSVDLGQISEIAYIFVYFRKYQTLTFEVFRTQGYTIRISNDTDPKSGSKCFEDTSYNLNINTRVRNHSSCSNITGRYVHFTNRGDALNHNNALLELCEVQVFGCPVGTFGYKCSKSCESSCLGGRCDISTGICFNCKEGTFINDNGICKNCPNNCFHCRSHNGCNECHDTYYLVVTENENACTKCPQICKTCENYNGCIACKENYYLRSKVCHPCPPNCSKCTDGIGCSMCEIGFALENSMCIGCEKNCLKCTNTTSCLKCRQGYFVLRNICQSCPDFCINCDSGGNCTKCEDRHYIGEHGKCIECLDTCRNCSSEGCTDLVDSMIKTLVNSATYVGASVGILVIFFTVTGLLIFYKRRKAVNQSNSPNYYEENNATIKGNIYDEVASVENPPHANTSQNEYYNTRIFQEDNNASYQNTF